MKEIQSTEDQLIQLTTKVQAQQQALEQKDQVIVSKEAQLQQKDQALQRQEKQIADLRELVQDRKQKRRQDSPVERQETQTTLLLRSTVQGSQNQMTPAQLPLKRPANDGDQELPETPGMPLLGIDGLWRSDPRSLPWHHHSCHTTTSESAL